MSPDRLRLINENTVLPLSLIITLMGGIFWLTIIYAQGKQNTADIAEVKGAQSQYNHIMQSIDHRLSEIEGQMKSNRDR